VKANLQLYSKIDQLKYVGFVETIERWGVHDEWAGELFNYFIIGLRPGSFHTSCFANDLIGAVQHSHISNHWESIQAMMKWVNEEAPRGSWGNYNIIDDWVKLPIVERDKITCAKWRQRSDSEVTFKLLEEA